MRTNLKLTLLIVLAVVFLQWYVSSCHTQKMNTGETAVRNYYYQQTDSLLQKLDLLATSASAHQPTATLQLQFANSRYNYKKIEPVIEYYFQGLTKRVNGPALPDIKTEDGQVWPPHGFQVIEQLLYSGYNDSLQANLSGEIRLLQTDLRYMRENMAYYTISANHIREIIRHQFIRIAAWGITGFDAPLSKLSLREAEFSLSGISTIFSQFQGKNEEDEKEKLMAAAITYLQTNSDFETFNRLVFLTGYLMPLSDHYDVIRGFDFKFDSLMIQPFQGTLSQLLKGKGFNGDYYSSYAMAKSNPEKIALGKKLFFDNRLSKSGTVSCGSCHQPGLFFTDGKEKAGDFVHGGSLPRNTPSLYYAALQSHQFYDLRSVTLEDQANEVMKNSSEFNFTSSGIAKKLLADKEYFSLFEEAFGITEGGPGGYEVRNALAAFVRSLSPFSSPFDEYMKGNRSALSGEQVQGFNLFTGKAKCATCHFIPLFNGNIPPWFTKSESEIIGVPSKAIWQKAIIDTDSGRYKINRMDELMFAFKTPTVRNAEKTAPYMHNGVYKTLDDVVEFYHKGGGVGIDIPLPF
ncbi:MAG: hypothetical protein H7Y01_07025, partial [Ferruginibacter sp.]|nr:hypothetical protein [Chitinophagaceae bacterium]